MICIMLTCHPEYSFLRKAMQLGCQDYLLKPVDEEDLEASLKKAVEALNLRSKAYRQEPAGTLSAKKCYLTFTRISRSLLPCRSLHRMFP